MTERQAPQARLRRFTRKEARIDAPRPAPVEPAWLPSPEPIHQARHRVAEPEQSVSTGAESPVGLAEFGDILRRRWKTIAATTALVTTLGVAFALIAKPQFLATTAIFVDPRNKASFQIEGSGTGAGYDPNLVDSQIVIIESDTVLKRVIAAEKLLEDGEFTKGPGSAEFNVMKNLKEAVKVKRPDRTYVVEVQVRTETGEKSARIANAIAAAYLNDGRDSKTEIASREQTWLDRHLKNLQDRLKEAEARVEAYKVENKILGVGSDGLLVGEQQLGELNKGIVEAQRRSAEAKALFDQVEALRRSGKLPDVTNDALKSTTIERLRGQLSEVLRLEANARSTLGPLHPAAIEIREQVAETRRQINEELGRIAEGARSAYNVARGNVTALERQLDTLKRDATSTNQTLLRLRELERAVEAQKAVYEKFLRDKEQIARLTVDTPAGRVIVPASIPQTRAFPNRPLIAAIAFMAGLFFGVALALALETIQRMRNPDEMPTRPQSPGGWRLRKRDTEQNSTAPSSMDWAQPSYGQTAPRPALQGRQEIERLAAEIGARLGDGMAPSFLVSGLEPGRGQPQLTENLGRALAALGWNVLLVDAAPAADSLKKRHARAGRTVEIDAGDRQVQAMDLTSGTEGALWLEMARSSGRTRHGRMLPACDVILIDGPAAGSRALEQIETRYQIDGVIGLLPAGMQGRDQAMRALDHRFGQALVGVMGRAA